MFMYEYTKFAIKILSKHNIEFKATACMITTEFCQMTPNTLSEILNELWQCIPYECITCRERIVKVGRGRNAVDKLENSIEIDTGLSREDILIHLSGKQVIDGIDYKEEYGYFISGDEIFITDMLDIAPETSFKTLMDEEDELVKSVNCYLKQIQSHNRQLKSFSHMSDKFSSDQFSNIMDARDTTIDNLKKVCGRLKTVREEIKEKFGCE